LRLEADESLLQAMGADEVVLRRFRPKQTDAASEAEDFTVDEGRGGQRVLNWQALRFDEDGCSVYRSAVLEHAGIPEEEILQPDYQYIARAVKAEIDEFTFTFADGSVEQPFEVVASPFPTGPDGADYEAAHASITLQTDASKTRQRQLVKQVARKAFICEPVELAAVEADRLLDK
jgi:hypothetical protein